MKQSELPKNSNSEFSVISAILMDPDHAMTFCACLDKNLFTNHFLQILLEASQRLHKEKIDIDLVTLANTKEYRSVSFPDMFIEQLLEVSPSARGVEHHIAILKSNYFLRKIALNANDVFLKIKSGVAELPEIILQQSKMMDEILSSQDKKPFSFKAEIKQCLESIFDKKQSGISTGFPRLDAKIGGLIPGDLIVIGGRPSMGKTALSIALISNLIENDKRILFFSLEMSTGKIIRRILSLRGQINLEEFKNGKICKSSLGKLAEASAYLAKNDLIIDDRVNLTAQDIREKSLALNVAGKIDAVFIDYLQIMKHEQQRGDTEAKAIGDTSKTLKNLPKELNCPVILLSQLNRGLESRPCKEPTMADLRGSGSIEQDADIIIFPYRPEQAKEVESVDNPTRLIIAKHRDGGLGAIPVTWIKEWATFREKY